MIDFIKENYSFSYCEPTFVRSLNISYGVDKNFMFGAAISIMSVLNNNKHINLVFHLFTDYIDDDFLTKSQRMAEENNVTINIYLIDSASFSDLPTSEVWSYATYFRLLSFDYLSSSISTVLYLDADVVCKGSLSEIYQLEFKDEFAAVIPDIELMQAKSAERLQWPQINGHYFNAGVIYVNLAQWKICNFTHESLKLLRGESKYGILKYLDQDVLNIIFNMNLIYLPRELNCIYTIKNELKTKNHQDYRNTISDTTKLIHYTGATKPWHEWARYPSAKFFQVAWKSSPWRDTPLKKAEKIVEFKKKYKHELIQGNYLCALSTSIKYGIMKYFTGQK
ncbi:lipopolysaccharide 1,2-glucosyltransferase [Salmonella enterica]|nr:lipopolysaccharide 1,2-glucosyltransferase [Salmonella enterica]